MLVDAFVGHQRKGIVHGAERTVGRHQVEVAVLDVEVVGLRGVGPPGIHSHVVHRTQVAPVQVAGLRIERIVGSRSRMERPGIERQQGIHGLQFLVLVRPGAEAGPDGYHQVSMVLVNVIHHLLRALDARFFVQQRFIVGVVAFGDVLHPVLVAHLVDVAGIHELHGIPVGITSPVLPVLHDAVQGYTQLAVLVEHVAQLVRTLVALAALPVAHGPEGKHGSLAGQVAQGGNHTVHAAVAIQEVVV